MAKMLLVYTMDEYVVHQQRLLDHEARMAVAQAVGQCGQAKTSFKPAFVAPKIRFFRTRPAMLNYRHLH
jgi:hypothetical protein